MQIKNNSISFPVLLERLPVRTPSDECVKALDADIGIGALDIHLDRDLFTLKCEEVLARTPADEIGREGSDATPARTRTTDEHRLVNQDCLEREKYTRAPGSWLSRYHPGSSQENHH